ncbi:AraC family transcriptional regulator [uncultured Bacteroides sp.]|uniref:helix-turn-helix domain-containing protein n=1 Tax=uncultured Bacteroides sp. TaxID=162156 RepID=UPI0025854EB2|nr:AraC family transcriptional regulator [uncultured Bacteroides sp.]
MKRFIVCIWFGLVFSFLYGAAVSFDDMRERIAYDPLGSLASLDSLETDSTYFSYQIDYLRALSYQSQSQYYMSVYYVRRAFETDGMQRDSILLPYAYMLWAKSSIMSFQLKEAAKVIAAGKSYALKCHNWGLQANMLQMEGDLYRKMGILSKSYECVTEAVALLSAARTQDDYLLLSDSMGYLMSYYITDNQLQKAWEVGQRREEVLATWEKCLSEDTHELDRQKGFFYSKMAYLAYKLKKGGLSESYFNRFYVTNFSKTQRGLLEINNYLLKVGRYEEVLRHNEAYLGLVSEADSLNLIRLRTLEQSSQAYRALGDYVHAYLTILQVHQISRQMATSRERSQIFQLADVTEAVARQYQLEKADYELKVQRYVISVLLAITLVLLVLFGLLWRTLHVIRRKNRKMAELVLQLDDQRKEIHSVENELERWEEEIKTDEKLFFSFDWQVKEQKLYLNYQLGRDDYAQLMGVDRNRFAAILKKFTSNNLSTYLNDLRLEYSVTLFREHPDWPINRVAEESALPRISTFYRLFKDKYGISPNNFRKTLN